MPVIVACSVPAAVLAALGGVVGARRWRRRRPVGDGELLERVRTALARDRRSWWLAQPEVSIEAGTVVVAGHALHADAHRAVLDVVRDAAGRRPVRDALVVR